jgi:hypothetical protein
MAMSIIICPSSVYKGSGSSLSLSALARGALSTAATPRLELASFLTGLPFSAKMRHLKINNIESV